MRPAIEFWFDFISPYAYLAWQRIYTVAEANGRRVELRPVLFAGLLDHWGQLGPAEIAPKRVYTFKQVSRRAHRLGVVLRPPPSHPFNPLLGLRLAALEQPEAERRRLIDLLFTATWGGGPGITDLATVRTLLLDASLDAEALLHAAAQPSHKDRLRATGREAVERGLFGVPTMIADGELFWGEDSFPELEAFLRGEDPLDLDGLARWAELPASSQRAAALSRPSRE